MSHEKQYSFMSIRRSQAIEFTPLIAMQHPPHGRNVGQRMAAWEHRPLLNHRLKTSGDRSEVRVRGSRQHCRWAEASKDRAQLLSVPRCFQWTLHLAP